MEKSARLAAASPRAANFGLTPAPRPFRYTRFLVSLGRFLILSLSLWAAACSREPDSFPPPPQRSLFADSPAVEIGSFINVNDPDAPAYFVRDVNKVVEAGSWRWTFEHPALRFALDSVDGVQYAMDYAIPDVVIQHAGPVKLTIRINGQLLDTLSFSKGGQESYRKAVPPGWLRVNAENLVELQLDKQYVTDNKVRLGFILVRAGFVK